MAGAQAVSSSSRLHRAATVLVEAGWLTAAVFVPLAVNPWGFAYELPKAALLRGLVLLMLAAHLVALAWPPAPPNLHDCSRHWLRHPLVRPALLVGSVALLSTVISISPLVSLWGSYHRQQGVYLLVCLILWALLVAAHLRTSAQRRRLLATIAVAGSLTALTPFIESFLRYENPLTSRPGGSLGNPIFLGACLIMAIPFTLAGLVSARRSESHRRYKSLVRLFGWGTALVLQVVALLIAQSRGPWVGALAGLMLFGALMFWPTHRRLVLGGIAVLIVLTSVLVASLNFDTVPASRFSQLPYVGRAVTATNLSGGTVRVRLVLWQAAWKVVTTWPEVGLEPDHLRLLRPLVGYGPDTAAYAYTAVYPPELGHIEDPDAIWDRAHNETLDVLAMQGWLGLIAWTVLGVACARRGLVLWQAAPDAAMRAWAAAPLAAMVAHVIEVQFAFTLTATALMGWLCVAWLAAPAHVRQEEEEEEEEAKGRIGAHARVGTRWRIYAVVAALLLTIAAVRLEGGAIWASALVSRARALDRAGQWQESVSLYDRALDTIPWQAAYHQFRGEAFYNLARALPDDQTGLKAELLNAADRSLARARRSEPLELEHYSNAGVLHAYWSETVDPVHLDTAVAFYRQAFLLAPTRAGLRTDLGHVYHNHARYVEALAEYNAALEIDPLFAAAYYDSGLAWLALDRPDLARPAFQAALELAPDCEACRDALRTLEE